MMKKNNNNLKQWIIILSNSTLALISFVLTYFLDPLKYTSQSTLAAIPAFLLSIVILIIGHIVATHNEVEQSTKNTKTVCAALESCLHITKVGTPKSAWAYVIDRLPLLEYVQNTSFNFEDEEEQTSERLYDGTLYRHSADEIAKYVDKGLTWKDIGDSTAVERFRNISTQVKKSKGSYQYKLIQQSEPQIGFIILTYKDGTVEVMFNWDFRDIPQDPVVLISRDIEIINMFAAQYKGLWRVAVADYDNTATKSTS